MDGKSLNIAEDKLEQLEAILPEAFTEGKVDWEKLRLTLGEDIDINDERYVLNWAGKSEAFKTLQTPTTATLAPAREESVNFDNTENIFIEGENLEVLKVLQKAYYGKIKMIYIDPPYNTGNDSFVYPDRFAESREEYLKRINDKDEEGLMMREGLFRKNSKDGGHYHSNWLSMMYPRLFLARNLLRKDGGIFISIDDNEIHNLILMLNEIFGEENFVGKIAVQLNPRGRHLDRYLAQTHEYVVIYAKDIMSDALSQLPKSEEMIREYNREDENGKYRDIGLRNRNPAFNSKTRPNLFFPLFVDPERGLVSLTKEKKYTIEVLPLDSNGVESCWTWGKGKVAQDNNLLIARQTKKGDWRIFRKDYLVKDGEEATTLPKSIWLDKEINNDYGKKAIQDLFGKNEFDFPKSPYLIKKIVQIGSNEGIILDFFAGSSTTAHGMFLQNIEDNEPRSFIMVQLPERTDNDEYPTIAEIGKERIRKVIAKLQKENPMFADLGQDLGLKVYKLKKSNFKLWRGNGIENQEELEKQLDMLADPVRPEALEEHMLFELLLKSGYPLTTQVEKREVGKAHYYLVDGGLAIALSHLDEGMIKDILELKPQQVICLDSLFADNDPLKTNTQLQFKDVGITFHSI